MGERSEYSRFSNGFELTERDGRPHVIETTQRLEGVDTGHKALMPGVTPRLTGHNAHNAPGIIGDGSVILKPYASAMLNRCV